MEQQQLPQMQDMAPSASYSSSSANSFNAPAGTYAVAPPQQMAPGAASSQGGGDCGDCCNCSNNKRSALYTWLPFGLRVGLFLWCLVAFSLCFSTKNGVTGYSAGAFLVAITILGFVFSVFMLVYLVVRIFVAGSEAYDASMDLAQLFESYIMALLLFAASTSASAACNMWWDSSMMTNLVSGGYNRGYSSSTYDKLLGQSDVSIPTFHSTSEYVNWLNNYLNDIQADVNKVRGACAMGFFAAFTYIALYWYYNLRIYKHGVLRASRDAAVPAGKVDVPPPYNV